MKQTRSVRTYMLVVFMVVIVLTAVAAWLPESWLIQNAFERQTRARVEQGRRFARTLHNTWQSEVTNAAILTAQLPNLQQLLLAGDDEELAAYLETVETSLALDLLIACDRADRLVARVGRIEMAEPCALRAPVGFYLVPADSGSPAWLLASQPVLRGEEQIGRIVTGIWLNDAFAARMRGETQLQHTIFVDGEPVATSFSAGLPARRQADVAPLPAENGAAQMIFTLPDGRVYYAARLPLDDARLSDEVALSAAEFLNIRRTLIRTGLLSIFLVVAAGSVAALVISRRISRPLLQLDQAATRLRGGDLAQQIAIDTRMQEVARVAQTLERTRADLLQTLTRLQQEKAWGENLLQAIVEGIMILDEKGRITYFSEGAARITGWPEEQVHHRHVDDIFLPGSDEPPFSELIPAPGGRRTIWVRLAANRRAALSLTRAQLLPPDADQTQLAIVFRDVTEEEAVQRQLHNFLANITHEFRTPLTALAAAVELLRDEAGQLTAAELEQMLTWLHLSIVNLQTLVDNLLETASLEAGRFRIAPHATDIGDIVTAAVRLMEPLLQKYQQRLAVDLPAAPLPTVRADSRRILQVIINLLSNANKFSPPDGEIKIGLSEQNGFLKIEVADSGPGIPAGSQGNLFHRFLHLDVEGDSKRFGVGLGLWVVKAIVEEHGGAVGAADRPAGGSVFWFTLPLAEER